jgi:prepilin-type N-terminal cleavage/methylation domain-containing protein
MKKNGFTLVELIASMAILTIVTSAIFTAFSTSSRIWSRGGTKLGTSAYAQSIIETFKSQGAERLKNMYSSTDGNSCYIYFDDNITNFTVYNGALSSPADLLTWAKDNSMKLTGSVGESYTSCKNSSLSGGRKYGAYIFIKQSDTTNKVYYARVRVWDLQRQNGAETESLREIYISR